MPDGDGFGILFFKVGETRRGRGRGDRANGETRLGGKVQDRRLTSKCVWVLLYVFFYRP